MADINQALPKTLQFEGGYVNDPADHGGETYCGIARKFWKDSKIWPLLDALNPKLKRGQFVTGPSAAECEKIIREFYKTQFWDKLKCDNIKSQSVAAYFFDWHVTSGGVAVKQVQKLVGVDDDGSVGDLTIAAINNVDPKTLFDKMVGIRVQRARDKAANDPSQQKFLKGWLNRFQGFQFVS